VRGTKCERDPEALEDRPSLRRGGGEYELLDQSRSPKKSAASRAADSGESEP
jgi:hypothetical protein